MHIAKTESAIYVILKHKSLSRNCCNRHVCNNSMFRFNCFPNKCKVS